MTSTPLHIETMIATDARWAHVQHVQDLRRGSTAQPHAARRHRGRGSRRNQLDAAIRESQG
jgi:hypothetical protein